MSNSRTRDELLPDQVLHLLGNLVVTESRQVRERLKLHVTKTLNPKLEANKVLLLSPENAFTEIGTELDDAAKAAGATTDEARSNNEHDR